MPLTGREAWASDLLSSNTEDLFDPATINSLWRAHLSGKVDNSAKLWDVLMLQNWRLNT